MNEEIIISGRNIPMVDPHLNIWHWPISVYLFLGGLAAGILFFAGLYTILGRDKNLPTAVKWSTFVAPFALVLGLIALFVDLKHQWYFWRLYTTIRIESPMSWGAWVLLFITPLSFVWSASYLGELIPGWDWKLGILKRFDRWVQANRLPLAWIMAILSLILGIYTGILLSAFNARPLWNTALLGPLFLTSGLSTGAAAIMWMSGKKDERQFFTRIDLILIAIELFFIIHLFMGFLAGPEVQLEAAELFLNGPFTLPFWGLVVGLGLILPAILEMLELRGWKIPAALPALLILIGGLLFRIIIVEAGEITRYLY
ncbi:MAG: polysulfide reductase NrfD [Phaeodactylibacter sp.]|nr:polysulfide reductase NrfD [Phaeodactylibacter sp.]MCB9288720.1 polysulfide reductase NrfD [Lewinellaceae bacterium]